MIKSLDISALKEGTITLRPLRDSDLEMTRHWRNKDRIRQCFKSSEIVEAQDHRRWFDSYQKRTDDIVYVIEVEGEPVGQISVYNIDRSASEAEFGRLMIGVDEFMGRGVAGRSTRLLVRHMTHDMGLQRLYLEVYEDNDAAIQIYKKSGFRVAKLDGRLITMIYDAEAAT